MLCRPFGACIISLSFRGLHPPLYPGGLSGLTLNFLNINIELRISNKEFRMDRDTVLRVPTFHQPLMNAKIGANKHRQPAGSSLQSFIRVYWRSLTVTGISKIKCASLLRHSIFLVRYSMLHFRVLGFSQGTSGEVFKEDECCF